MPSAWWKGKQGQWYVVIQAVLFALVLFGPRSIAGIPGWPQDWKWPCLLAGGVVTLTGAWLVFFGAFSLGRNLTPLPHPKDDAALVVTGAYRLVRHPIYGGIIISAYGWSLLVQSLLTLAYATLLFFFLDLKSRREERGLRQKFPDYLPYSQQVRRLIPFLY